MAKKKRDEADVIFDLLELAEKLGLSNESFEVEVEEECREEGAEKAEEINSGTLMNQLEFLRERGWRTEALKRLMRECASERQSS